jgi:Arc/MetJ-type ribon-helix-helix transcriptional regulator
MASDLSPQYEAFINEQLSAGTFPSRERLLEAALDLLRDEIATPVPDEHIPLLDEAEADIAAGRVTDWDPDEFLRRVEQRRTERRSANG